MHHRTHAGLALALELLGFLAGIGLSWYAVGHPLAASLGSTLGSVGLWLVLLVLMVALPRGLFRALVPARCPACGEARAHLRGSRPWTYACRGCGQVHVTSVSDGGGPRVQDDEQVHRESPQLSWERHGPDGAPSPAGEGSSQEGPVDS